jgi:hypothetical protein
LQHYLYLQNFRDWNTIQAAEIKYLRTVKGCTRLDQIRNEDIRNELGISPLSEKIMTNSGINGKHICKEWNIPAFHYRHININHPENET